MTDWEEMQALDAAGSKYIPRALGWLAQLLCQEHSLPYPWGCLPFRVRITVYWGMASGAAHTFEHEQMIDRAAYAQSLAEWKQSQAQEQFQSLLEQHARKHPGSGSTPADPSG